MHKLHQNVQAMIIICGAWLSFAAADGFSKYLVQHYPVTNILLVNGLIGIAISLTWLLSRHGINGLKTKKIRLHILRAIWATGTSFSVVSALKSVPLADFYGISFISPFIIALLAYLLMGEQVGWRRIGAMVAAFIGVIILAGPQYESHNAGLIWAFMVPVFVAFNALTVRKIGHGEPLPLFPLFPFIGMTILNGALLTTSDSTFILPSLQDLPFFLCCTLGVIGGLLGFSRGFAKATESVVILPFMYTQIIWGTIIGFVFFNAVPSTTTFAGAALIIGAGLFSFYREYRLAHPRVHSL